jgi:hypothetical protein
MSIAALGKRARLQHARTVWATTLSRFSELSTQQLGLTDINTLFVFKRDESVPILTSSSLQEAALGIPNIDP